MSAVRNLEFELRRLAGVAAVGFEQGNDDVLVQVLLERVPAVDREELRRQVVQLVRTHFERPAVVEVEVVPDTGPCRPPRVQVLAVRCNQSASGIEIHLGHRGRRTVGRGPAISPGAAAVATLEALAMLGASLPFRVDTIPGGNDDGPVVVVARSDSENLRHYGVASGRTPEDAACRAALHALNRYLERDDAFSTSATTVARR